MGRIALGAVVLVIGASLVAWLALRTGSAAGPPPTVTLATTISGGEMRDQRIVIGQGDRLLLRVTADRSMRLQLEGYEIVRTLKPGQAADILIVGWYPGLFVFRDEGTGRKLGVLTVETPQGR